jgi:hypothetical protein
MLVRGSLKKCIKTLEYQLTDGGHKQLSIVHCPRGKYYTVLTEDELLDYNNRPVSDQMRLLWRGTLGELKQFARLAPPDLFTKDAPNETS